MCVCVIPCLSSLHNEGPTFQCAMSSHSLFLSLSVFHFLSVPLSTSLPFRLSLSVHSSLFLSVRLSFPEAMCLFLSTVHLLVSVFKLLLYLHHFTGVLLYEKLLISFFLSLTHFLSLFLSYCPFLLQLASVCLKE